MKKIIFGVLAAGMSIGAFAQSAEAPVIKPGDTWDYKDTVEKGPSGWTQTQNELTVLRATASTIYYTTKTVDSTQAPKEAYAGLDWSRMRSINGTETVVNKPLTFPLKPGKSWEVSYTELHPNKLHNYEQWDTQYKVVGFETVEVPAGKFSAIKIEGEGKWVAEVAPATTVVAGAQSVQNSITSVSQINKTGAVTATGRVYRVFWYVPDVKRMVKSVEEYYGSNGVRNERYTEELVSFKLSD